MILGILLGVIILIFSSILHEIAHGYVAYRLGDPTAKLMGRLSLNPKSHIDPYMSVVMPLISYIVSHGTFMFGGAKPVPVDPFNLRDGIKDLALVSLAGPATNIVLAVASSVLIHLLYPGMGFAEVERVGIGGMILTGIVQWNLILAIFNLVPVPPLDGSKVFALILPRREASEYLALGQKFGMFILFFLLFFPIGPFSLMGTVETVINFSLRLLGF